MPWWPRFQLKRRQWRLTASASRVGPGTKTGTLIGQRAVRQREDCTFPGQVLLGFRSDPNIALFLAPLAKSASSGLRTWIRPYQETHFILELRLHNASTLHGAFPWMRLCLIEAGGELLGPKAPPSWARWVRALWSVAREVSLPMWPTTSFLPVDFRDFDFKDF